MIHDEGNDEMWGNVKGFGNGMLKEEMHYCWGKGGKKDGC